MNKEKNSKYGLLKVLGITFLIFAGLTMIVPTGYYNGKTFTGGETAPVGLYGLFINPTYSFGIFAQYLVLFLTIGGFYGVLNKTGAYSKLIDGVAKKYENKKTLFLVLTIVLFALLSSIVGSQLALFIFVPFAIAILMTLGYDKLTALAATVGAILVGIIGSTYGTSVVFKSFMSIDVNKGILFKVIFFAVVTTLYTLFVVKRNKKCIQNEVIVEKPKRSKKKKDDVKALEKKEEVKKVEIPLYNLKEENKSIIPLAIILGFFAVLILVGMFNWYHTFGVELFNSIHSAIMDFEVGGIKIFAKIFGSLPEIGYFGNYDLTAIILIVTVLIGWVYGNKFDEFVDGFVKGAKEMVLPAIYVMLASVIFAVMVNNSSNISATIVNFLTGMVEGFNVIVLSLIGLVSSFFFNDFPYLVNGIYGVLGSYDAVLTPVITLVLSAMYGIAMMILPVSITLIAGLKYMNISYKEWVKYIWKFLVGILVVTLLFALIALAIIK
ncbi:MAG: hypothetical protein E7173_02955 [Firmicutes bacterium]|nr:hypothetical protein [Bacillota bacterium]